MISCTFLSLQHLHVSDLYFLELRYNENVFVSPTQSSKSSTSLHPPAMKNITGFEILGLFSKTPFFARRKRNLQSRKEIEGKASGAAISLRDFKGTLHLLLFGQRFTLKCKKKYREERALEAKYQNFPHNSINHFQQFCDLVPRQGRGTLLRQKII